MRVKQRGHVDGFLPEVFREAREDAGLSLSELARRLGVSVSVVHAWDHGVCSPTSLHLNRVAQELGVSRALLLDEEFDE